MNDYETKQAARRERLINAAENARTRSNQGYQTFRGILSVIPMGQPILIGHHSQRRHENALKKADNAMRRSVEEDERAKELARRADSVGSAGISSDDPDAIDKLKEKLESMAARHQKWVQINKALKKNDTAALEGLGLTSPQIAELHKPDFCGRVGIPDYQLTNSSAEQRRLKKRIEQLEANATRTTKTHNIKGVEILENVEDNRLQMQFNGKPAPEIIQELKRWGFKWSPTQKVWQRMLNNGAIYAAKQVLAKLPEV